MAIEKWEDSWDTFFSHEYAAIKRKMLEEKREKYAPREMNRSEKGKKQTSEKNEDRTIIPLIASVDLNKMLKAKASLGELDSEEESIYNQLLNKYHDYINSNCYLSAGRSTASGSSQATPSSAGLPPRIFVPYSEPHAPLVPCNHHCQLIGYFNSWHLGYQVIYHHRHHRFLPTTVRPTEGVDGWCVLCVVCNKSYVC
jgi:hypothetical protein